MERGNTMERVKKSSLTARYVGQDGSEFNSFLEERWESAERIKNFIKAEVEAESLEPLEAGKLIACMVGQLFGYGEFHSPTSPDVVSSLLGRLPVDD